MWLKKNLRDRFGSEIFPGECYLKKFYLKKNRSEDSNIKKFFNLNYDMYLTPDEIFEPLVEI